MEYDPNMPVLARVLKSQERIRVLEEQVKELQEKFNLLVKNRRELAEASSELATLVVDHLFGSSKKE